MRMPKSTRYGLPQNPLFIAFSITLLICNVLFPSLKSTFLDAAAKQLGKVVAEINDQSRREKLIKSELET
jgi:hypothetical protein